MAANPNTATFDTPLFSDPTIGEGSANGTQATNVGDFLIYSGQCVIPTAMGALANVKASAAGIAIDSNPRYDSYGNTLNNSALRFIRGGVVRVSANFSGQPTLGTPVYPASTGSAVNAATGLTGVGATWGTAVPVANSANALGSGVGIVVKWHNVGNGGTGEMDIYLPERAPDYY